MTDTDNSEGKATARVAVAGATGASSTDLWFGTANLNAIVTNPSGTDIKIRYRIAGTDAWTELNASKGADGYTYTAQATDFKAGRTYECQLLENGAENGAVRSVNTEAGIQLPNAGFEEWRSPARRGIPMPAAEPNSGVRATRRHFARRQIQSHYRRSRPPTGIFRNDLRQTANAIPEHGGYR